MAADPDKEEDDGADKENAEGAPQRVRRGAEKRSGRSKKSSPLAYEIWGVAFLALGLLVLIALVSYFVNNTENVLGPYFGTALSRGLVFLFGAAASVCIPLALGLIGWKNLTGRGLPATTLVSLASLIVEVSLLLSIANLPGFAAGTFTISENYAGNSITDALHYLFGAHRFGPYFLTLLAMVVTGLLCFRVTLAAAVAAVQRFALALAQWARGLFEKQVAGKPSRAQTADPKQKKTAGAARDDVDDVEREHELAQEKELQAFRAKLKDPVKITTMTVTADDFADDDSPADGSDEKEPGARAASQVVKKPIGPQKPYRLPDPEVLSSPPETALKVDEEAIHQNSQILEKTLLNFDIEGKVFNVCSGPVVTRYEIELAPGVKVSKVLSLQNDIAMAVGGQKIRIEAPIPGKAAIGIELPNRDRQVVHFKHILLSETFKRARARLPMIVGQNISGLPFVTDIDKMPHLLVAGQTGSGKSVCINTILCSLLMTRTPEELRLIMIDPKKVELTPYEGIPHLISPVVTEPKEAVKALYWAVMEIQNRFGLLKKLRARDIESANAKLSAKDYPDELLAENEKKVMSRLVIFVDELADLMLTASKDVESHILRIAQLGRAAGIHLIVATQRPSVDIITGPIKANLASRMAFRTIQSVDSRTILGHIGAEQLLGMGDMLFLRNGAPELERYHGAFISEADVESLVGAINSQHYEMEKFENFSDLVGDASAGPDAYSTDGGRDDLFEEAARLIVGIGQGSTSLLQRRMKIGYARAGRIMDELELAGIVGPAEGSKMREVRMKPDELEGFIQNLRAGSSGAAPAQVQG